jgi:hypothetical protein
MSLLKSFGKILIESIAETMAEGTADSNDSTFENDDFSNSYRLNGDGDIATDLEGKNSADNGGQWVRKE